MTVTMSSKKPYHIRAIYEWILDNDCTPYVLVDAMHPQASVPQEYVSSEGQVVLNVAPSAVQNLSMEGDFLCFSARFRGISTDLLVPYESVLGIYAKENQKGMMFDPEPYTQSPPPSPPSSPSPSKPGLRIVK